MRYLEHLAIQEAYQIKQREFVPPFVAMYGVALSLHLLFLLLWSLLPASQHFQPPLHSLQVRLGGGDQAEPGAVPAPTPPAAEQALRPPPPKPKPMAHNERPAPKPRPKQKKPKAPPSPVMVRTPSVAPAPARTLALSAPSAGAGATYGDAAAQSRQIVERYTRQISAQVQAQASSIRLTEELKAKTSGRQVVAELLLVIGQDGRLTRYAVTRSSGFAELDQAAVQAVYNASPYPPPPAQYAGYGFKVAVFME